MDKPGLLYLGEAGLAGSEKSGPGPAQPCDLEGLPLYLHEPQATFFGSSLGNAFILFTDSLSKWSCGTCSGPGTVVVAETWQ